MYAQMRLFKDEANDGISHKAEPYIGIYGMHKYWSKKPYNIVRQLILRYTNEGEIIVDPFCGSGISIAESIFTGRKAVGVDINPSAILITKQLTHRVPIELLREEFRKLELDVKDTINSFYVVRRGGKEFVGTHFLWKNEELQEIWYNHNTKAGAKQIQEPKESDLNLALSFSYDRIPYFYPKERMFENARINTSRDAHVYDLFTPRNLMALSLLMDRIEKIENEVVRECLQFCFTAAVGQASKMVFVVKQRGKFNERARRIERKEVGSWVIGYWVPEEHFEINAWNCFENRYRKILKAKTELGTAGYSICDAECFDELLGSKNLLLTNEPCQVTLKQIPDNCVDYIITDPPHGNRQPYLELSMMWNSWLKKQVDYENEIVISESKDRKKDRSNYYHLLDGIFAELDRILKPMRHFSLMFNSLDDETWMNIIECMGKLNLELEKVETLDYSANSVVQDTRGAALKTDFILTFKKTPKSIFKDIELMSLVDNEAYITSLIERYLRNTGGKGLETYQVLNLLISELLQQNKFIRISEILNMLRTEFEREGNRWTARGI